MARNLTRIGSAALATLLAAGCSGGGDGGGEENRAPSFTSAAPAQATEDVPFSHAVTTADPDQGDTRTLGAATLPPWLALDDHGDGTATLSGTPGNEDVGQEAVALVVTDQAGRSATQSFTLEVVNVNDAPTLAGSPPLEVEEGTPYLFQPSAADVDAGDVLAFSITGAPAWASFDQVTGALSGLPSAADVGSAGPITLAVADLAGASATLPPFSVTVTASAPVVPPDPAGVAPPLPATVATAFGAATSFLYTGQDPIQTGVAPGTIDGVRAAVLRGRVLDQDGDPLPGVRVTVLGHPELGRTHSRADGRFDLAVNGGGELVVSCAARGYLPAQRKVHAPWREFAHLPDVALVPLDPAATTVTLSAAAPPQVARGSEVVDADGARRATVLVPAGTLAAMELPQGATEPVGSLSVRATEFTVGPDGPARMPAELPPTTAYTYAFELSADEALAAGATGVTFSKPLPFYVEDFVGFPVGSGVPAATYDRQRGQWVPMPNGRVVEVLAVSGGVASVDTDGDGAADDGAALGMTADERAQLGALYPAGRRLWRVPVSHFSPFDCNWPRYPPPDADGPLGFGPDRRNDDDDDPCKEVWGSEIECSGQVFGEALPLAGTPLHLHYRSDRVPGRRSGALDIPVTGASVHPDLLRAVVEVRIAGHVFRHAFPAPVEPDLVYAFDGWDGTDAYGRAIEGPVMAAVTITYEFEPYYISVGGQWYRTFGEVPPGSTPTLVKVRTGATSSLSDTWKVPVGGLRNAAAWAGLGGWTLSEHHFFSPEVPTLYLGSGGRQVAGPSDVRFLVEHVRTAMRTGESDGVAVGPDGSVYFAETPNHIVWRGTPRAGTLELDWTIVAGNRTPGYSGDGGNALAAQLTNPSALAVGPDGSLYILGGSCVIRRVGPDGLISTVAGNGTCGYSGDFGPATSAQLSSPSAVALAPDGGLYVADRLNRRVRRVGPDGVISTVAGTGVEGYSGDGGPATEAQLRNPTGVAVDPDGNLYVADSTDYRIRRVDVGGTITTCAGTGRQGNAGDGGSAEFAEVMPYHLAFVEGRGLFVTDDRYTIRRIGLGGVIRREAGGGECWELGGCSYGDGGPALLASLNDPGAVAGAPDGSVVFMDQGGHAVRRLRPPVPSFSATSILLPLEDGSRLLDFHASGRHDRTLHPLTGEVLHAFEYDAQGLVSRMADGQGNTLASISRTGGEVTITGAEGQVTTLLLGADGYLATFVDPRGERTRFEYAPGGLLARVTRPTGATTSLAWDELGRLIGHEDASGTTTLSLAGGPGDRQVTLAPAGGVATVHRTRELDGGGQERTVTPEGCPGTLSVTDGTGWSRVVQADGSAVEDTIGPDPRFGLLVPATASHVVTTPGGLRSEASWTETATLGAPGAIVPLATSAGTLTVNGADWRFEWDGASSTLTSTTPAGRQTRRTIDAAGRVTGHQAGALAGTAYEYDALGRPTEQRQGAGPGTRTTTFEYGADGRLSRVTDALGRFSTLEHDAAGRLIALTGPGGATMRVARDGDGEVTAVTTPRGLVHLLERDPRGLLAAHVPPAAAGDPPGADRVEYGYDTDRQLSRIALPDGTAVLFGRGCLGRVESIQTPEGLTEIQYHPATGRPSRVTDPRGVVLDLTFDGPLLLEQRWSGPFTGRVTRAYGPDFLVARETVNGLFPVDVARDGDGLPVNVGPLSLAWDPSRLLVGTEAGLVSTTLAYDAFGDLAVMEATDGAAVLLSASFQRDALGRITSIAEVVQGTSRSWVHGYDAAGRLESATLTDGAGAPQTWTYAWDESGNRVAVTGPGGFAGATLDPQDRLLAQGDEAFSWARTGRLAGRTRGAAATAYQHDARGSLVRVDLPDGRRVEYLLDGTGRRVGKRVDGALVQAFLHGDDRRIAAELDGTGAIRSRFVHSGGAGAPDLLLRDGATYRLLTDHRGSVRLVVNVATGEVVQRIDYDPWGQVLADTSPGFQPFGFAGGLHDPDTGLVHRGAREYDPSIGRFTSRDPLLFGGGDGNLYGYASGDPVNQGDPTGLVPCPNPDPDDVLERIKDILDRMKKAKSELGDPDKDDPLGELRDWKDLLDTLDDLNDKFELFDWGNVPVDFILQEIDAALDALEVGLEAIEEHHQKIGSVGCTGNQDGTTSCGVH